MRDYETTVILKPDAPDAAVKALAKKIEKVLEGKPGKITKKDDWGVKRFAYPIHKEKKGRYLFWAYSHAPSVMAQLERILKFEETVLRYMTVTIGETGHVSKKDILAKAKAEKASKRKAESQDEGDEGEERRPSRPVKVDYKDPMTLVPFISERGKISPQRQTRFTATQQRALAQAIKRSRFLALLSYVNGYVSGRSEGNAPQAPAPEMGGHAS